MGTLKILNMRKCLTENIISEDVLQLGHVTLGNLESWTTYGTGFIYNCEHHYSFPRTKSKNNVGQCIAEERNCGNSFLSSRKTAIKRLKKIWIWNSLVHDISVSNTSFYYVIPQWRNLKGSSLVRIRPN